MNVFSVPSSLRLGLIAALFAACGAGCGPAEKAGPGVSAPSGQETRRRPVWPLPPGVTLESLADGVTATFDLPTTPTTGRIEFLAVFPPGARLSPDLLDYTLAPDEENVQASSPDATIPTDEDPTTPTTGPREAGRQLALSDAVERELRRQLTAREEGIVRFHRLVRVVFNPGPIAGKDSRVRRFAKLTAKFPVERSAEPESGEAGPDASAGQTAEPAPQPERGFDPILRRLVANPEALALYADRAQGAANSPPKGNGWSPRTANPKGRWLRVPVSSSGLYRVTADYLRRAGLNVSNADMAKLRVFSRGKETPTHVVEDSPAPMASREIVFYGRASDSPYSAERAYWLNVPSDGETSAPLRMRARANPGPFPEGIEPTVVTEQERLFEEDRQLLISCDRFLTTKHKNWVWDELEPEEPIAFSFDLPDLDARTTQAVTLDLTFSQTPRERLQIDISEKGLATISFRDENVYESRLKEAPPIELDINGSFDASLRPFEGASTGTVRVEVGSNHLRRDGNVLILRFREPFAIAPNATCSNVFFDRFTARYRRWLYARGGQLEVRTTGERPWHRVAGFGGARPIAFDLTDPEAPSTIEAERLPQQVFAFYEQRAKRDLLLALASSIPEAPSPHPLLATDIASPDNEADYLLVYHPMFEEEIRPLLEYRERQGMKTKAANVEAVYQEYAAGESTPHAVKDFLLDALRRWKTPPSYVCLFGDASSDYRGELRTGIANLVPAYSWAAWDGDTWASELWYACLIGSDLFPDAMLGRISVRNVEDAREVVRKTLHYGDTAPLGPWRARIGYCADDGETFASTTDRIRSEYQSPAFGSQRVYLEDYSFEDNYFVSEQNMKDLNMKVSTQATLALHDAYERGLGMMVFLGHGSPNIWTDERIWFGGDSPNSDNLNMRNGERLPFVATFTCNHGAFDFPLPKWNICISEDMMRVKKGGSVAMYVPSGPGTTTMHDQVARSLFRALMDEGLRRTGEIAAWTALDYVLSGGSPEMIRMFVLLGDPALDLALPTRVLDGRAAPDRIDLNAAPARGRFAVRFEADASDVCAKGRFSAFLYDPEGREVLKSGPRSFRKGKIEWKFALPESPASGQWIVQGYCADPASGRDGVLSARFVVGRPNVSVSVFEFDPKPEKTGAEGGLRLEVSNDSEFAVREVAVGVSRTGPSGREETLDLWRIDLAPREKKTLRRTFEALAGLQGFNARVERGGNESRESDAKPAKELVLYIPPEKGTLDLATLPSLVAVDRRTGGSNDVCSANARFFYSGLTTQCLVTAVLSVPDGSRSTTTTLYLRPPSSVFGEAHGGFSLPLAGATPCSEVRLRAFRPEDATAPSAISQNENESPSVQGHDSRAATETQCLVDLAVPVGKARACDLAILPGSVKFEPAAPSEGETVFVSAALENRGNVASSAFDMRLFSVEKGEQETPLESRPYCTDTRQPPLDPGCRRDVRLRFDYDAGAQYAGERTIRVKADPLGRLEENDKTNNALDAPLRVLSRAQTTFTLETKLTDSDATRKKAQLTVRLKNLGEAAAKGRRVGFFSKPPKQGRISEAGSLVKDILLPPLRQGEERVYSHKWVVDFKDAETSPTALVYRPTKALRAEGEQGADASTPDW